MKSLVKQSSVQSVKDQHNFELHLGLAYKSQNYTNGKVHSLTMCRILKIRTFKQNQHIGTDRGDAPWSKQEKKKKNQQIKTRYGLRKPSMSPQSIHVRSNFASAPLHS